MRTIVDLLNIRKSQSLVFYPHEVEVEANEHKEAVMVKEISNMKHTVAMTTVIVMMTMINEDLTRYLNRYCTQ